MAIYVCGEKIDDAMIQREMQRLRPYYERVFKDQSPEKREAQLLEWSTENVIERVLLAQEARKQIPPIPRSVIDAAFDGLMQQLGGRQHFSELYGTDDEEKVKEQIELDLRVERLLQQVCADLPTPSDKEIADFYEQNKQQFEVPEQILVAHIVKHVDAQTDEAAAYETICEAYEKLQQGVLFEILVPQYSDCPDNGGNLGYIRRGQMVEEFEDVVFNLGTNEVSGVFQTRFGFHIAKLYDRKPAYIAPLDKVKQYIIKELKERMRDKAIDDFLDQLRSKAQIQQV